jgi:hypothetical protein
MWAMCVAYEQAHEWWLLVHDSVSQGAARADARAVAGEVQRAAAAVTEAEQLASFF